MRKIFIDLGANTGEVSAKFAQETPEAAIFCVEPNRELIAHLVDASFGVGRPFTILCAAAWTHDGMVDFFQSGASAASTVVAGKVEPSHWPAIDYTRSTAVPCFDLSQWLSDNFRGCDITLKMDVEGAEYALLERMMQDRTLGLVGRLLCEWHWDRFPAVTREQHDAIRTRAALFTNLEDWG